LDQSLHVTVDRVVLLGPPVELVLGHVVLVVMLGVAFATIRLDLDEVHAVTAPRPLDREPRRLVHREHIVPVHGDGRDTVALRLLRQVLHCELLLGRGRIRPAVVFRDHDQRDLLHRGEVEALVERPRRGRAVAHIDQPHPRLAAQLEGQRDPGHHRDHVAEMGNLAEVALFKVVEMHVQLAPVRGAVGFGHVLAQDGHRLGAHDQQRAQVTDQRRENVRARAAGEGVRGPDRLSLLTEGAEQAADHLALAVQGSEPLFQGPCEPQEAIDFEQLIAREARRDGR